MFVRKVREFLEAYFPKLFPDRWSVVVNDNCQNTVRRRVMMMANKALRADRDRASPRDVCFSF